MTAIAELGIDKFVPEIVAKTAEQGDSGCSDVTDRNVHQSPCLG